MTTEFLTINFAKFPNFIVMEFPGKTGFLDNRPYIFPLPNPLQNANFINIVVSAACNPSACNSKMLMSPTSLRGRAQRVTVNYMWVLSGNAGASWRATLGA